ncbi:ribosomal RNA small subunit methyltransferase E [Geomonas sp. Red276]
MRTFFLGDHAVNGDLVTVTGELYRHMARVLRLKAGDEVALTSHDGSRLFGAIEEVAAKELIIRIGTREHFHEGDNAIKVTLYQGLPKGDKFELILQKCTELGVAEVVAFEGERSVVKLTRERGASKLERFQKIAQEAARQSGRPSVPAVRIEGKLGEVLRGADQAVKLILWEEEQGNRLKEAFEAVHEIPDSVAVVVGPEGGLSPEEVAVAKSCGFVPVSLGKRILRTETAGLAMLAILQYQWGDMG